MYKKSFVLIVFHTATFSIQWSCKVFVKWLLYCHCWKNLCCFCSLVSGVAVCWAMCMGIMPALLLLYLKVFKLEQLSWPGILSIFFIWFNWKLPLQGVHKVNSTELTWPTIPRDENISGFASFACVFLYFCSHSHSVHDMRWPVLHLSGWGGLWMTNFPIFFLISKLLENFNSRITWTYFEWELSRNYCRNAKIAFQMKF